MAIIIIELGIIYNLGTIKTKNEKRFYNRSHNNFSNLMTFKNYVSVELH
jgi:hypothetical protein